MSVKKPKSHVKKGKVDEVNELRNQLARALADYDNLRKRSEIEIENRTDLAKAQFVIKLISLYDMLIDAQKHLNDSGIAIIIEEFDRVFEETQIEKIKINKDDDFDEELCEAIETVSLPTGGKTKKSGKVADVVLNGWKFINGPVIRPVKVKVYK